MKPYFTAFFLFFTLFAHHAKAQCPTSEQGFTFGSQQQINDFGAMYAN